MMMNKMREIYGVVNMILFPEDEDPEMLSLELLLRRLKKEAKK